MHGTKSYILTISENSTINMRVKFGNRNK